MQVTAWPEWLGTAPVACTRFAPHHRMRRQPAPSGRSAITATLWQACGGQSSACAIVGNSKMVRCGAEPSFGLPAAHTVTPCR
ncbi:hypothetical protein KCP71_02890 [Salmonella enterica subsp. enterica]|nr:hypothetical protein KCP71_02890 [Salmonella enterica subsp. enterica]